jgi:hypothetical protein
MCSSDRAFGERLYSDTGERHVLVKGPDVLLIAAKSVELFCDD